jgi:hypothetical protein
MNTATGVQHCADQWEQRAGAGDWDAIGTRCTATWSSRCRS